MQTNGLSPNLLSEPISQQPRLHHYMTCRSKALGLWPNLAQGATESTNPPRCIIQMCKQMPQAPAILAQGVDESAKIHNNETRRSKLSSSCYNLGTTAPHANLQGSTFERQSSTKAEDQSAPRPQDDPFREMRPAAKQLDDQVPQQQCQAA